MCVMWKARDLQGQVLSCADVIFFFWGGEGYSGSVEHFNPFLIWHCPLLATHNSKTSINLSLLCKSLRLALDSVLGVAICDSENP